MKYAVSVSIPAWDDFEDLIRFLRSKYSNSTAKRLIIAFDELLSSLESFPMKHASVDNTGGIRKVVLLSKTVVYFSVIGDQVVVLSVRDGRSQILGPK